MDSGWLDFLGYAVDCHVMTIKPGQTRGNHYHSRKREILIVMHKDRWTMCWDGGSGTAPQKREFAGAGAVVVKVFPSAAHAIVNSGEQDLHVMALCNEPYDPALQGGCCCQGCNGLGFAPTNTKAPVSRWITGAKFSSLRLLERSQPASPSALWSRRTARFGLLASCGSRPLESPKNGRKHLLLSGG